MTPAERKAYYRNFNESRTSEEWEQIRSERKTTRHDTTRTRAMASDRGKDSTGSISFSIKNNSIFFKRIRIADNTLKFRPFATNYVGFKPGTKVYLIKGENEEDEYLFTITKNDEGKSFKISK